MFWLAYGWYGWGFGWFDRVLTAKMAGMVKLLSAALRVGELGQNLNNYLSNSNDGYRVRNTQYCIYILLFVFIIILNFISSIYRKYK